MLALCCQLNAQTIFVTQDGTGNGSSWQTATTLEQALRIAITGTQIWVAGGTYRPTQGADRKAAFIIPDGVQVFGGFAGVETSVAQRPSQLNPTILSGEIGKSGAADNSYNVVYIKQAGASTILDGFVITAGNANGEAAEANRSRSGGGLFLDGENGACNPQVRNCTFKNNQSRDGAAVYINGRSGEASPLFDKCEFSDNVAGLDGGAIYNDGRLNGKSNPTLTNCSFNRNIGTYGGAICNANESGICNLTMENCSFTGNEAFLRGGAIVSLNGDEKCYLELTSCTFKANYPDDQNMITTSTLARSSAFKVTTSPTSKP